MTAQVNTQPSTQHSRMRVSASQLLPWLYVGTLLIECIGAVVRLALVGGFFWVITKLTVLITLLGNLASVITSADNTGQAGSTATTSGIIGYVTSTLIALSTFGTLIAYLCAFGPIVASILSLYLPGGFFAKRFSMGAREASLEERRIVDAALDAIGAQMATVKNLRLPRDIFVIDSPVSSQEGTIIGSTLYLSRGLIRADDDLMPVLAHLLGHMNTIDGRLTLALRRLVLPPVYMLSRALGQLAPGIIKIGATAGNAGGCLAGAIVFLLSGLLALAGGGCGTFCLSPVWSWFWRQREYAADAYAAELGQSAGLIGYLQKWQGLDIVVPYLMSEVPASELRIDHLLNPTYYTGTDRVNLTPWLASAGVVIVLLCIAPTSVNAVTVYFNSPYGMWKLEQVVRSDNNTVIWTPETEDAIVTLEIDSANGFTQQTLFHPGTQNAFMSQEAGTVQRTGVDELYFETTDRQRTSNFPVNGRWRVERSGDHFILHGASQTYEYIATH